MCVCVCVCVCVVFADFFFFLFFCGNFSGFCGLCLFLFLTSFLLLCA